MQDLVLGYTIFVLTRESALSVFDCRISKMEQLSFYVTQLT